MKLRCAPLVSLLTRNTLKAFPIIRNTPLRSFFSKSTGDDSEEDTHENGVSDLEEELLDLKNKLLLSLADQENLRKRTAREIELARKYGMQSWAKNLLEIPDTLRLALLSVKSEDLVDNPTLKSFVEGMENTEKIVQKAFNSGGVFKMNILEQTFDPNFHEAVFNVKDPELEPNTIAVIVKDGYMLNDRILRAAKVGIVKDTPDSDRLDDVPE